MTHKTVTLPYCPRFPQTVIHKELESHRFKVLPAHRRMGKTVLAINHLIKKGTQVPHREPRLAYIAPFLKQAKLIAWAYLKRYTAPIPGVKVNESELWVELPNGANIRLFGADNADAIRGTYLDEVVLDEYGQFKKGVYEEVVRSTLADRNGGALFLGTPKGQNQFYEVALLAQKQMAAGDKDWWYGCYRADETGVIPLDELAKLKATLSDRTYRQEFLCDFSAEADNVLITIDSVTAASAKVLPMGSVTGAPKILGVDPARYGDDRSVIIRRQGLQAFDPLVFQKMDNMTLAGRVAKEIDEYQPDAVFIDAGRGEGVIDRLRQLGYAVTEVNFGGQPTDSGHYSNKRSEMWDLMREWIEQGGALPKLTDLKSDLVTPTYDFDAANRLRLESKDSIKERLGKSPDMADALALTFAFPVRPKAKQTIIHGAEFAQAEYNPLG